MIEQRAAEIMGKVAGVTEKVTYASATGTIGMGAAKTFCGLLLSDWSFIVAIFTTAAVGAVTVYCKIRHIQLEEIRTNHEIKKAKEVGDDDD